MSDFKAMKDPMSQRGLKFKWWRLGHCFPMSGTTEANVFFDENPNPAKRICADCPMKDGPCLEHAINNVYVGVAAGRSQRELRRLRQHKGST